LRTPSKKIKNILIYHISGMSFGGTEKNLQIIANNLVDEYNVFFMYSNKGVVNNRLHTIDKRVNLIEFDYETKEQTYPFFIKGMNPHIKNSINENEIVVILNTHSIQYQRYQLL
jgi:hypothetical protein